MKIHSVKCTSCKILVQLRSYLSLLLNSVKYRNGIINTSWIVSHHFSRFLTCCLRQCVTLNRVKAFLFHRCGLP